MLQPREEKEEITKAKERRSAFFTGNTLKQNSLPKKVMNIKRERRRKQEKNRCLTVRPRAKANMLK